MAQDTSAPSWWNWLYPTYEEYRAALTDVLPPFVPVGPVPVPRDAFILSAWFTPGGQSGLYTRLAIAARDSQLSPSLRDGLWSQLQDQAAAGGFGEGGGFGGSFGWKAEPIVAQLIIPNVYRVAIEAQSGGQAVTNVVGVRGSGPGLAQEAAEAVQDAWEVASGPLSRLGSYYQVQGYRALDLSSSNGSIALVASTATGTGASTSKATNGACALVKWNGGTRSRSSRGRLYYGPVGESDVSADGRTLVSANQGLINTAMGLFRSTISSLGFTLCVISPTTSQAFDVSSHAVEPIIATQRRRIRS